MSRLTLAERAPAIAEGVAVAALRKHRAEASRIQAQATRLAEKIEGAGRVLAAAQAVVDRLAALRQERREQLGRAFAATIPADTSSIDAAIHKAEHQANEAAGVSEMAEVGLVELHRQELELQRQAAALAQAEADLRHAAAVEIAEGTLATAKSAFAAFADAYGRLVGACAAVDLHGRLPPCFGNAGITADLRVVAPKYLPSCGTDTWRVDLRPAIDAGLAAGRAALEQIGKGE